jgi:hypothetical protein
VDGQGRHAGRPALSPDDNWTIFTSGARADWARGADDWTVDGSVRAGAGEHDLEAAPDRGAGFRASRQTPPSFTLGHVLGRWTTAPALDRSIQVQTSAAILDRPDFDSR